MEFWSQIPLRSRKILAGCLAGLFLLTGLFLYPKPDPAGEAILLPEKAGHVTVYATGAVRRPGVYRLHAGTRVRDLLRVAGGPAPDWDPEGINLAKKLEDEDMVAVPRKRGSARIPESATSRPLRGKKTPVDPVRLNRATLEDLTKLPGVGPGMALRILEYRKGRGSFGSVDDLENVPGMGKKKVEKLRPFLLL